MSKEFRFVIKGIVDSCESVKEARNYLDKKMRGSRMKDVSEINVIEKFDFGEKKSL